MQLTRRTFLALIALALAGLLIGACGVKALYPSNKLYPSNTHYPKG